MKLVVSLCIIVFCQSCINAEDVKSVMMKSRWGVEAGTAIFNAIGSEKVSDVFKYVGQIAGQISPFLGAIGPVLHLITLFIPTGPSPEMIYMKKQFAIIDSKFAQVFNRFEEVKNLIKEESMRNMYSDAESKIKDMAHLLSNFHNASSLDDANFWKGKFLSTYSTSLEEATRRLWRGMTQSSEFSRNIPLTVLDYTDNNRPRTQKMMKRVMALILKGAQIIVSYNELKGNVNGSKKEQAYWDGKMKELIQSMIKVDEIAEKKFITQYVIDVDKRLADWYKMSDEDFMKKLFDFLNEKYDWQIWYVIVFDWRAFSSSSGKAKQQCTNAMFRYKVHDRSLYVVSTSRFVYGPYQWEVQDVINKLNHERCQVYCGPKSTFVPNAEKLYNRFPDVYKNGCKFPGLIVFQGGKNQCHYKFTRYNTAIDDVRGHLYRGQNYIFIMFG